MMNDFIHLPAHGEYQSYWINFNHVQSIRKIDNEKIVILYINGSKEILSGIWACILLDCLEEPSFPNEATKDTKFFEEIDSKQEISYQKQWEKKGYVTCPECRELILRENDSHKLLYCDVCGYDF